MIFTDTGAWFALLLTDDPNHQAARDWFRTNRQILITTDYVIDETLTLLKARGQMRKALEIGRQFFANTLCQVYFLTEEDILETWRTFERYADKEWSFTDCSSKVVMDKLEITQAFAFDHHFRQFGTITVVPE